MTSGSSGTPPPPSRLAAIDALRGVAVLAVLVSHLPFSMSRSGAVPAEIPFPAWSTAVTDHGRFGVHLFLILSGFCIHMAWARRPDHEGTVGFAQFWRRRLHRLYPPYFAALVASIAGLYVLHTILGGASGSIAERLGYPSIPQLAIDLVLLVLLAQNLNNASQRIGNGPFWTLALEEQLYALYFPLLWMRRKYGWTRALVVVGLTTVVWRVIATFVAPESWGAMFRMGPARWFEWTLGALAVEAHLGRVTLPAWARSGRVGLALLAVAIACYDAPRIGVPESLLLPVVDGVFGIALFTLVNYACHVRWAERGVVARFFAWVGTFSYSLYLTHQLVIVAAKQLALRLGLGVAGVLCFRAVLAIAGAWAFFQIVERRFLNSSRRAAPRPAAVAPGESRA